MQRTQKKGAAIRLGDRVDLDRLYAMYAETAQRDGFIIRPIDYYRDAWGSFIQSGLAQPLIAEVEGEAVAGLILFRFADRAWYMYGMSRNLHREQMPNHLLQWEGAMRWSKMQGCTVYATEKNSTIIFRVPIRPAQAFYGKSVCEG